MSLSLVIAINVVLDVALLGFLTWMMSHPRHLTPHASAGESVPSAQRRVIRFAADQPGSDENPQVVVPAYSHGYQGS